MNTAIMRRFVGVPQHFHDTTSLGNALQALNKTVYTFSRRFILSKNEENEETNTLNINNIMWDEIKEKLIDATCQIYFRELNFPVAFFLFFQP